MMISKGFFIIIMLTLMIFISPAISLSLITFLIFIYLVIYKVFLNKLFENGKQISQSIAKLYSLASESLNGIKETKFYVVRWR